MGAEHRVHVERRERPTATSPSPRSVRALPLVVIQEWWGLVPHIQDVCDRFAAEGFLALAPDLYRGETTTEPDEAGKLMMALNLDQAAAGPVRCRRLPQLSLRSRRGAPRRHHRLLHGRRPGPRRWPPQRPDKLKRSCVPWYGLIPWPTRSPTGSASMPRARSLRRERRLLHPGSGRGARRRSEEPRQGRRDPDPPGVDHAFFNDTRPEVYNAAAAGAVWQQTVGFLLTNLG